MLELLTLWFCLIATGFMALFFALSCVLIFLQILKSPDLDGSIKEKLSFLFKKEH